MDKILETCEGCGAKLRPMEACKCGHKRTKGKEANNYHFRCVYSHAGVRCPMAGTISEGVSNKSADRAWWCVPHWRARGDPYGSQMIMEDYEKNGVPITIDWVEQEIKKQQDIRIEWFRSQHGKDSEKNNGGPQRQDADADDTGVVRPSEADTEHAEAPNKIGPESGIDGGRRDDVSADEPW